MESTSGKSSNNNCGAASNRAGRSRNATTMTDLEQGGMQPSLNGISGQLLPIHVTDEELERAFDEAPEIPMSKEEIDEIVRRVVQESSKQAGEA